MNHTRAHVSDDNTIKVQAASLKTIIRHTVGKKVFSQPPIVQVLPLKKMREACNFHHRYTSTMRDKIRKKIQKITLLDFLRIYLQIMVENKYLVNNKQARLLALTDL